MSDTTFVRRLEVDSDARTLFDWHARPGAFERLAPPWERVTLEGSAARLVPSERQTVRFSLGPLRLRWRSEITAVEDGERFEDVQLSGPFAKWVHSHSMQPLGDGRSVLEDRVEYRLPLGVLGRALGGRFARQSLERLFSYRHRVTAGRPRPARGGGRRRSARRARDRLVRSRRTCAHAVPDDGRPPSASPGATRAALRGRVPLGPRGGRARPARVRRSRRGRAPRRRERRRPALELDAEGAHPREPGSRARARSRTRSGRRRPSRGCSSRRRRSATTAIAATSS